MKDTTIFDGKTLHALLKDVDALAAARRGKIVDLIDALRGYMTTPHDVATFAPMIRDYLDVWIKNDEHLIKVGTIAQRIISAESYQKTGGDMMDLLSEAEKDQLIADAVKDQLATQNIEIDTDLAKLDAQVATALSGSVI